MRRDLVLGSEGSGTVEALGEADTARDYLAQAPRG